MNKKPDCKQKYFEACVNVYKRAGEKVENYLTACSVAAKQLCSDKTKLSVGTRNLNANVETENNIKSWVLIVIFVVIILLLVWKFVF
jgi:hypothetical protein